MFSLLKIFRCSIENFVLFALRLIRWLIISDTMFCELHLSLDENYIFFHSFFTFGATKINTVTFSRFIYIIFYRKCQNYLCFIFLLKFDIMFLKKIPISILFHLELFFKIQLLWIFTSFFVVENLLWFKLFNVWMILSNWQWFRIVSANQSDEGEQYVPGYNGGSKGGRSSGMLRAHFLYI